ncbi:NAD(P)/FAD-dependent oxidoreductase [Candidimonas nitroreducens]|uniref:Pyridine nucleotide-disulfide oxidoreductase n=1 Tax=Candidimonas nitroreducens TaxID=683354 RepID=A0A225LYJ0_9BURK|nr:FAD/NAD(P)-binding oxidoreductase [Candidimonas nitroreducens]OWT54188.1 pyridine nucleotide-disulfide oxidoreductase [Candidimonas nitroreducens]
MAANAGQRKHQIVIVGGGAGGLSVASAALNQRPGLDIAVIEPSESHYYQPAWTLVGGGAYDIDATQRAEADCMPRQAHWIKQRVATFEPDHNQVTLEDGSTVGYDYLVTAAGIQLDWGKIEGLEATLGKNGVTSNYSFELAPYTWECIRNFRGGKALFTYPATPIKCAGAPQKILYLAADHFRRNGIKADVHFCTAGNAMFGVPFYSEALDQVMAYYGAAPDYKHNLVAVDGPHKKAIFEVGDDKKRVAVDFDMIHVVPPQSPPDFIKTSPLANEAGWVAVNAGTLRHDKYANVFGLGDCTSTPNSKTAAAVRAQSRVLVPNLLAVIDGEEPAQVYDGYASCPLTTSKGKMMLAEFVYGGKITPSFPADPRVPRRTYWWMKTTLLPKMYWDMVQGRPGPDWHAEREFPKALPAIQP